MKKLLKGYTLIELLVVIGIIATLIGFGSVAYSTTQKKARDAKRKGDLRAIQNALEQYYSSCNTAPYTYPFAANGPLTAGTTLVCGTNSYITYPADPQGGNYLCTAAGTGCSSSTYRICPPLRADGTGYVMEAETCTLANPTCCLTNQQ